MRVVSNTSPLSNLTVIGEIKLLQQIYPKILIPPAVSVELMHFPEIQPAISTLIEIGWIEIHPSNNLQLIQNLNQVLDPGEAAAIALSIELNADRLLIDERLGRKIAIQYGLKIRGLLGIIVYAKQQGFIPAVKPLLDRLINEAGFRVSQPLYVRTLQESDE